MYRLLKYPHYVKLLESALCKLCKENLLSANGFKNSDSTNSELDAKHWNFSGSESIRFLGSISRTMNLSRCVARPRFLVNSSERFSPLLIT